MAWARNFDKVAKKYDVDGVLKGEEVIIKIAPSDNDQSIKTTTTKRVRKC